MVAFLRQLLAAILSLAITFSACAIVRDPSGMNGAGALPSVLEGGDFSSQFPIDNPVTTLLHYPRKVVRLAFRETPLTT